MLEKPALSPFLGGPLCKKFAKRTGTFAIYLVPSWKNLPVPFVAFCRLGSQFSFPKTPAALIIACQLIVVMALILGSLASLFWVAQKGQAPLPSILSLVGKTCLSLLSPFVAWGVNIFFPKLLLSSFLLDSLLLL